MWVVGAWYVGFFSLSMGEEGGMVGMCGCVKGCVVGYVEGLVGVHVRFGCDKGERGGCLCSWRLMSGCPWLELF